MQLEESLDDSYEPYVTDEEEKFGFWFFGERFQLGIQFYDSDSEYNSDSDDQDDDAKFQRLVLSSDCLTNQIRELKHWIENSEKPWSISLIQNTSNFVLIFIRGLERKFFLSRYGSEWSLITFQSLVGLESDGAEFNRIICCACKTMIFEMSDRSLFTFRHRRIPNRGWKRLNLKSSEIHSISSSVHCLTFAFIRKDIPFTVYFIDEMDEIVEKRVNLFVGKLFTPFSNHVLIDTENRYYNILDDYSYTYRKTSFERVSPIRELVGGYYFSIVLLENGTVWASGDNDRVMSRRNERDDTFYQIDISIPNIQSINAFSNYGVISTPFYHLLFGQMPSADHLQRMKLKRFGIKTLDVQNVNIIETENKYFNVDGFDMIFIYEQTYQPILFQKWGEYLFKSILHNSLKSFHHGTANHCDLSFECSS